MAALLTALCLSHRRKSNTKGCKELPEPHSNHRAINNSRYSNFSQVSAELLSPAQWEPNQETNLIGAASWQCHNQQGTMGTRRKAVLEQLQVSGLHTHPFDPSSEQFGTWRMSSWERLVRGNKHKHCWREGKATQKHGREVANLIWPHENTTPTQGREKSAAIAVLCFQADPVPMVLLKASVWWWEKRELCGRSWRSNDSEASSDFSKQSEVMALKDDNSPGCLN